VGFPLRRRLAYRLLASDRAAVLAERAVDLIRRWAGPRAALGLVERFGARVVWSGWPHHVRGWTELHAADLYWRLRRRAGGQPPSAPPPKKKTREEPPSERWRVGLIGPFRGLLGFERRLFERAPDHVELFVYDMEYEHSFASYLDRPGVTYRPLTDRAAGGPASPGANDWADRAAACINGDRLDTLLHFNPKPSAYSLMDRLDTRCVVNVCTGSELLHHERVDVQIYAQPEAGYRLEGRRLVCDVTNRPVGRHVVVPGWVMYDARGLEGETVVPWRARQPLIVCHGSLYKLNSPPFLAMLTRLLNEDASLEFVYMGRDRGNALRAIEAHFSREGAAGRAHYDGSFEPARDPDGRVAEPGWERLVGHLRRARLAPNPWPVGGGSARVEAYLLGAPTVHMALGPEGASPSHCSLIDLPALLVRSATARGPEEYLTLCRRCLTDEAFANDVMREQRAVACHVTDATAYWDQVGRHYRTWLSERP
jgi:hypothetical protein